MASRSTIFEDMLPRNFPQGKKQLEKNAARVPKPTLPGVSIIDDKSKVSKAAPKKSFLKWKQQHEALFEPVKFQTTNHPNGFFNKQKNLPHQRISTAIKVGSDFHNNPTIQPGNQQHQQFVYDSTKFNRNFPRKEDNEGLQNMMKFSHFNRIARSEAMKIAVHPIDQQKPSQYVHFQANEDEYQSSSTNHEHKNTCTMQNHEHENEHKLEPHQQLVKTSKENDKKQLTNDALVSIVEEQIEIVKQQKQILMQQNEIFTLHLQYQIDKLLLVNGCVGNKPPIKHLKSITLPEKKAISPDVKSNVLAMKNDTSQLIPHNSKSRTSIGVMTSFRGNLKDMASSPHKSDNQKTASEKDSYNDTMLERINTIIQKSPPMIDYRMKKGNNNHCRISPKRGDVNISTQTLIYKTSSRNNVAMNDAKFADRSFALHLLDMKYHPQPLTSANKPKINQRNDVKSVPSKATSANRPPINSRNDVKSLPSKAKCNGYISNTPKTRDVYDRPQASSTANSHRLNMCLQNDTIEKTKRTPPKFEDDDFILLNISPDKYDYLIRHELLKK